MTDIMFTVFRTILSFLHFVHNLLFAIRNYGLLLRRKFTDIWNGENFRTDVDILVEAARKATKLPRHIVIIFGPKANSIADCVRLIGWCMTLEIPYISFFDTNGFLSENESYFKNEVALRRPDLVEYISWEKSNVTPPRNGITTPASKAKLNISLLSNSDGKGEIITLTKELAKAVTRGIVTMDEISDDLLSEKLKLWGIPDPDLAVVYGRVCSTYGLLPWHTRTTEFFMLPLYFKMTVTDFTYLLEKYSKCEQRFGK